MSTIPKLGYFIIAMKQSFFNNETLHNSSREMSTNFIDNSYNLELDKQHKYIPQR